MKKKKLLLVYPKSYGAGFHDMRYVKHITGKSELYMNLALPTVAALTPPEFDVKIIDENVEEIDFNEQYDLVGISGYLAHVLQAKRIAKEFSSRGVLVVCGGPSVSVTPELWRPFSDVLIVGEAERIWPEFTSDYLAGSYKNEYVEKKKFDISISPLPDYSNFSSPGITDTIGGSVQTSRGCPYKCEFCYVTVYLGHKMRYKQPDQVVREIAQMKKLGKSMTLLVDDNFSGNKQKAKNILKAIREWNRQQRRPMTFGTQLSIDTAKDEEFLELAAEAGLTRVTIGIETPNAESLKETGKFQNVGSNLLDEIKRIQQHGIMVICSCTIGYDNDDLSIFQKQFDFFMKSGVPNVKVHPLHAVYGTPLRDRMIKEGRYIDTYESMCKNPDEFNHLNSFSIIPKQITLEQLEQGLYWLLWKLYDMENLTERVRQFFETYENSPKKNKISIFKTKPSIKELGVVWRLFKHYMVDAPASERKAMKQMFNYARKSSHPQGLELVIGVFLSAKNIPEMLKKHNPQIAQVTYPEPVSKAMPY